MDSLNLLALIYSIYIQYGLAGPPASDTHIFNKVAIQGKGPNGKWTRKPLTYRESNIFNLCVIHPPEICDNLVFKHIHAASSYTICR